MPLYGWPEAPGLIFTERRADLRRHAGEVSFPGGRADPGDADLAATALREAKEEIALDPAAVELAGALPPVSTFVTGYRIQPFVGLFPPPRRARPANRTDQVQTVLAFQLRDASARPIRGGRLIRRGVPIHTPTYELEGPADLGGDARILGDLLERLHPAPA